MISEKTYYEYMSHFDKVKNFEEVLDKWYKCFDRALRHFRKVGYKKPQIDDLFFCWEMENWHAMWQENSEYKDYSKNKLKKEFAGECCYICDRVSYDRLFRTHWLFRKAWEKEFNKVCATRG